MERKVIRRKDASFCHQLLLQKDACDRARVCFSAAAWDAQHVGRLVNDREICVAKHDFERLRACR